MSLRLLRCCVVGLAAAGLAVSVDAQSSGIRENSYKPRTPFADVSGHPRDSSPLGTVDGGVNQSIGLDGAGQFEGAQSRTAGLDQLQPSPRGGGQRSGLALSGGFSADAGARRFIPPQAYAKPSYTQAYTRPSYMASPRMTMQTADGGSRLGASGQGGLQSASQGSAGGASQAASPSQATLPSQATSQGASRRAAIQGRSNALTTGSVPGRTQGRLDAGRRAAGYGTFARMSAGGAEQVRDSANMEMPASGQDAAQSPFERLGDPFRSASATGFEAFGTKSAFARPCGDACSFRSTSGTDPFGGGSRNRGRAGEMPDSRFPDTEIPDAKVPAMKITLGQELKIQ
jgi:hypothetical protein